MEPGSHSRIKLRLDIRKNKLPYETLQGRSQTVVFLSLEWEGRLRKM